MKIKQISHSDLDGVVSAILVQEYCRQKGYELEIHKAHYSDILKTFKEVYDKKSLVILTDVSFDDKEPEWVKDANNILMIDHHTTNTSKIKNKYIKFDKCASSLVYEYFTNKGFVFNEKFKNLVTLANDYDLFIKKYQLSTMLNYLYFLYKFEGFLNRFKDGYDTLNKEEIFYLKQKQKQIKNILTNLEFNVINEHVAFVTTEECLNEISVDLYTNRGFIYVFIYNPTMKSLSLRSRNDAIIHCGEFLQLFGGGGHKCAAGLVIGDNLNKINEVLKGFEIAYDEYHPVF